jgi:hypothetical protein
MICAIHQPQFVPWLGHFQKIARADIFVFLDNVQFRKNEFQNRNRIGTEQGARWLTVPVSFHFGDTLREVKIAEGTRWEERLWKTLEQTYRKAPHFESHASGLRTILEQPWGDLAALNAATVRWLVECFGIETRIVTASELPPMSQDRTGRLVDICRHLGADTYLSGAQAQCYLDVSCFEAAGIAVEFQTYEHPVYPQVSCGDAFVSHMSAIDGLFNCGGGEEGRARLNL